MTVRSSAILAVSALAAALGCYNPNIAQGGLKCAPGNVCPENYHCASDLRCYRGDAGPDMAKPICTSTTPDAATCSRPATSGQCNPACEFGCGCGWCAVVSGTPTCVMGTPGTKAIGDLCDPSKSADCAPGLFCRAECGTGRCYKYCEMASDCPGTTCSVSGGAAVSLCALAPPNCDPVKKTGCPAGYGCYVSGNTSYCDCAGTAAPGAGCHLTHDCAPGGGCVGIGQDAGTACEQVCRVNADCTSGICTTFGTAYGYCL